MHDHTDPRHGTGTGREIMTIDREAAELYERLDRQLAAHQDALSAGGGELPFKTIDLLRECRDYLRQDRQQYWPPIGRNSLD